MTFLNKFLVVFLATLTLVVIFRPQIAKAEIATTRDWIGLFKINSGYSKADTVDNCPYLTPADPTDKHCWFYTSTCNRTVGSIPAIDRSGTPGNPACDFNPFSPGLPADYYVYRLMANDGETLDALIATSKQMYSGVTSPPPPAAVSGKLYHVTGDLILDVDLTVEETGVIFVDGDLYININQTNNKATKGIVFIVGGTIYIKNTVDTVNAFLISHTGFCSAYDVAARICQDALITSQQKALIINGSVVFLNPNSTPTFTRKYSNPPSLTIPAETINYDPKYLVIMKDIFSRDLKIWREIQ